MEGGAGLRGGGVEGTGGEGGGQNRGWVGPRATSYNNNALLFFKSPVNAHVEITDVVSFYVQDMDMVLEKAWPAAIVKPRPTGRKNGGGGGGAKGGGSGGNRRRRRWTESRVGRTASYQLY